MPDDLTVYFECSVDGSEPIVGCTSPFEIPRAGVGEHSFEVTALHPVTFNPVTFEEIELMYEPLPSVYEWVVVDTVAPDTTINWGPQNPSTSPNAYFGVSSTDPAAVVECSLDFEDFSECGEMGIVEYEELLDGPHTLMARAVDENDNPDPSPAVFTWTVTRAAANTPAGQNVVVTEGPVTVTYWDVSLGGSTSITELGGGPLLPEGYTVMGGKYYAVTTTAEYGDPVSLCIDYDPQTLEGAARILEWDGSLFTDVTTTNNPQATATTGRACAAEVEGFSIYALVGSTTGIPLPTILTGPDPVSDSNTATFTFMSDVPDGVLLCSIDGVNNLRTPTAQWAPCESPMTFTYLEDGSHKFEVQAMAPDGTVDVTKLPALWEWEVAMPIDVTAPETQIVKGPGLLTGNEITQWEFTGIDDQTIDLDLEFECLLDGVLLGSCDSVLSQPNVPGVPYEVEVEFMQFGKHTFEVRAIDELGNIDPTPAKQTFTYVDVLAPDTEIDLGPESETEATIATFTFLGEEENGTFVFDFECSLDGADFTYCSSPHEVEGLTVGPHVFEVRAMDPSGRVDTTPDLYEWLVIPPVDRTAPDTLIQVSPGPVSGPDVIFGINANELVEEFECAIDGEEWGGCDSVVELEGLTSGQHRFEARSMDLVGNVDPTPVSHTWLVQGEPETTITDGPDEISGSLTATFVFESDQPNAEFFCSLNGSPFVGCDSPWPVGGLLMNEDNSVEIYAANEWTYLDGGQVQDLSPAEYEWLIQDVIPPETEILNVRHVDHTHLEEPNSIEFELRGSDNGTIWFELEFECQLDNGPWEGCDTPFHYLPIEELPGGEHVFRVRAIDDFENVDPSPAEYRWTSDAQPETTVESGPVPESDSTTATFRFSAEPSAGATFECILDGASDTAYTACPAAAPDGTVTFTGVPYGQHLLMVRARSAGGVIDLTPAEYEWVDRRPDPARRHDRRASAAAHHRHDRDVQVHAGRSRGNGPVLARRRHPAPCEAGVAFTYSEEQLALATGTSGGPHTLEIIPMKQHLLVEIGTVVEWMVDDQLDPDTFIDEAPPARVGMDQPSIFVVRSNEIGSRFECALDAVGTPVFEGCAGAAPDTMFELTGLEPGMHTILVRAVDPAENVDGSPVEFEWEIVGPSTTTITLGPPREPLANTRETSATFEFSVEPAGAQLRCSLDGADPLPCNSGTATVPRPRAWRAHVPGPEPEQLPPARGAQRGQNTWDWTIDEPLPNTPVGTDVDRQHPDADAGQRHAHLRLGCAGGHDDDHPLRGAAEQLTQGFLLDRRALLRHRHRRALRRRGRREGLPRLRVARHVRARPPAPLRRGPRHLGRHHRHDGRRRGLRQRHDALAVRGRDAVRPDADRHVHRRGAAVADDEPDRDLQLLREHRRRSFECSLDGDVFGSCSNPHLIDFTGLPTGTHSCGVRAMNGHAEVDLTPAAHTWTIGPPPETAILSGPEEATESGPRVRVHVQHRRRAVRVLARRDGRQLPVRAVRPDLTFENLAFGDHELLVRAKDAAGNVDLTPAEYSWEIGGIPPLVLIEQGPDIQSESRDATFVFSADTTERIFMCSLDGSEPSTCQSPKTYPGLPLGAHTFEVYAWVDPEFQISEAPISTYEWTVVAVTPPDTNMIFGPPPVSGGMDPEGGQATFMFAFSSDKTQVLFECALDSEPWSECENPAEYSNVALGDHLFRVRAYDLSVPPNYDPEPATWPFRVVPSPETTIVSGPEGEINGPVANFQFSSTVGGSTYECALDLGPFVTCTNPYTLNGLTDGEHLLEVRARTADGVVDPTPEEWSWAVDGQLPETKILTGPLSPTISTGAVFTFSSNEGGVEYECSLDGGLFEGCEAGEPPLPESSHIAIELTLGEHTLRVRAVDEAGFFDPTPASWTWRSSCRPTRRS